MNSNKKLLIFLIVFFTFSIVSASGMVEILAEQDFNYTIQVTNSTNAALTGATCTADTHYPNGTLKDKDLTVTELNSTEANGLYFATIGSTYDKNETGIYTLSVSCTSGSETGAAGEQFAIVRNKLSFLQEFWQIAIILGLLGVTGLLLFVSKNYIREKEEGETNMLKIVVTGIVLLLILITLNVIHAIALDSESVEIQDITLIGYRILLWFFWIWFAWNLFSIGLAQVSKTKR